MVRYLNSTYSLLACRRSCWGLWAVPRHLWCPVRRGFPGWWMAGAACDWLTRTGCRHPLPGSDAARGEKAHQKTVSKSFVAKSPHCHMTGEERGLSWVDLVLMLSRHTTAAAQLMWNRLSQHSAPFIHFILAWAWFARIKIKTAGKTTRAAVHEQSWLDTEPNKTTTQYFTSLDTKCRSCISCFVHFYNDIFNFTLIIWVSCPLCLKCWKIPNYLHVWETNCVKSIYSLPRWYIWCISVMKYSYVKSVNEKQGKVQTEPGLLSHKSFKTADEDQQLLLMLILKINHSALLMPACPGYYQIFNINWIIAA